MERTDLDHWRSREVARLLALVETQRRYYQEIVASIPVGLMVLSVDFRILLANGAARKIFELHSVAPTRRMDTVLPPSLLDHVEEVLKTGVQQTGIVIDTNAQRRMRVGILPIRDWDEDAAQEALVTVEDLTGFGTPPELSEVPTAPSVEISTVEISTPPAPAIPAQQLLDSIDSIVWAVELPSMKFVFANPQAERLLGFAPDHWTSHPSFWLDRIADADRDRIAEAYQRAIQSGLPHTCEFQAITAAGNTVWLRESARLVPGKEGEPRYMIGVAVDVTERRMLEEQLVQSERVEAVSRLASRMAHDLNNMLMILTGYGEELLSGLPAGSALRTDVQEILAATDRISSLTNQLLSFTRKQGASANNIELESTLHKFGPRLNALLGTHVKLEFFVSQEVNGVRADVAQLEQVMVALVERARQGMHAGEKITVSTSRMDVTEDLRHSGASLPPGNYAVISVAAPGQPLDAEARAALFECSLPGKEPWDDVAASLSRAYGFVRQWGGDIAISNIPRSTTLFRVFLPRFEPPERSMESAPPAAMQVTAPVVAPAPLATILVVEDEPGIRALVRKILRRQGYEVLEAANGEDALALCREHGRRVDLLISDVLMPQMGGRELVERLQTQGHDMKVLYVSGYTGDSSAPDDLPPGTAFLQKPFTLGSLLDKVREVLAR